MDKTIAVIGAGTMGSGISHVSALHGYRVLMLDAQPGAVERAQQTIAKRLTREVEKGGLTAEEKDAVLGRLVAAEWDAVSEASLAIEAVLEIMDVKKAVFQKLDELLPADALMATNTSSLSITEIAATTRRPEQVLGLHFFNPAPVMKLIEIVRGEATSDGAVEEARAFASTIGKETVVVEKDTPGFVVNRVLMPLFIEAMRIYEEGIASKEDIDKAVKLGLNHPMGPLTLADLTGLDVDLHVMDYMFNEFHDDRFAAPLVLRRLVRAGRLGRKTKHGFYDYDA
ncbi:3-hydroxyacyl-CoA dehydrogenase family protein [Sulfobacillus harzensis]|uniref:3-hydroxybutyryl-CoA dehydrogenase n=1 Tax=Sulfobacillus harzensis TaxID=2729629 RepID=A0A7Y0L4S0_9FIRM|nr:3-hydroxyacyl-CoA dehydrogenase NAD-binding domain-containing protein [Sulfobacillus harzensis]NMP22380.1 3-hydroxybutyryl-CoA dehydrogenase [Sulfobacillus harzensis]